jgi:hypothetical protein
VDVYFLGRTGRGNNGDNLLISKKIEKELRITIKDIATRDDLFGLTKDIRAYQRSLLFDDLLNNASCCFLPHVYFLEKR